MNVRRVSRKSSAGSRERGAARSPGKPRRDRSARGGPSYSGAAMAPRPPGGPSYSGAAKAPRPRRGGPSHASAAKAPRPRRGPLRSGPATLEGASEQAARWPDVSGVLKRQPWNDLTSHLLKIDAEPAAAISRLRRYCELVLQWNRKVSNLISKNDEARIVSRHILESLEPAHWLKDRGAMRWLDFGSGAGLPAIPLALSGVGGDWTLVESRRTKTLFLRRALEELDMKNVSVVHARLEDLLGAENHANSYDGFTSRATLTLVPTLAFAATFVRPEGTAFLWKGSRREEEMTADRSWREKWDFDGLLGIGEGTSAVARFRRK